MKFLWQRSKSAKGRLAGGGESYNGLGYVCVCFILHG